MALHKYTGTCTHVHRCTKRTADVESIAQCRARLLPNMLEQAKAVAVSPTQLAERCADSMHPVAAPPRPNSVPKTASDNQKPDVTMS